MIRFFFSEVWMRSASPDSMVWIRLSSLTTVSSGAGHLKCSPGSDTVRFHCPSLNTRAVLRSLTVYTDEEKRNAAMTKMTAPKIVLFMMGPLTCCGQNYHG